MVNTGVTNVKGLGQGFKPCRARRTDFCHLNGWNPLNYTCISPLIRLNEAVVEKVDWI